MREAVCDMLERLPRTFCHFDLFPPNMFMRDITGSTHAIVAIDWSFSGIGAPGEDLAGLIGTLSGSLAERKRWAQAIVEGYLAGLEDAGWRGDSRHVEFAAYTATGWRYTFGE